MKITLVGTYSSPEATGLRFVSSYLKSKGHQVRLLLMTVKRKGGSGKTYGPELARQFLEKVSDSDLIGMGLMTNTYYQARELTALIKEAGIKAPVVWGGVHPTVNPESCVEFADAVCVGEGEGPMEDIAEAIANGRDYANIPNLWVRRNGEIIKNEVRPLLENLDALPFPDYQIQDEQYVVHRGELVPASVKNLRGTLARYRLLSTRGCPYNCAFCCNSTWLKIYKGKGRWVRKRSVGNVIAELEDIKRRFGSVNCLTITDDTFFVREESEFEEFAALYRSKIGWPFEINTHPATITERKIELLQGCGCAMVKMGVQSGSQDTNYDVYNRRVPNETTIKAMEILNRFPRLQKEYHYIVTNPFEPDANVRETLQFAAEHHSGNFRGLIFPLALFPGSELHRRAVAEGILKGEQLEIYEKVYTGKAKHRFDRLGYQTMLLQTVIKAKQWGIRSGVVRKWVNLMLAGPVRFALDRAWFMWTALGMYLVGRSVNGAFYQMFVRPFGKHRRKYDLAARFGDESGQ